MKAGVLAGIGGAFVGVAAGAAISFPIGLAIGSGAGQNGNCGTSVTQDQPPAASATTSGGLGQKTLQHGGPDQEAVFQAVAANTGIKPGIQQRIMVAHLTGSYLESRWNRLATNGAGYGVDQIEMPGVVTLHVTVAQAEDVQFAITYMSPRYAAAYNREEVQSLWAEGNDVGAAEANAFYAEKAHDPYHVTQGQDTVQQAFDAAVALMRAHGIQPDFNVSASDAAVQQHLTDVVHQYSNDACRSGGTTSRSNTATLVAFSGATGAAQKVLDVATAQIGVPYAWGGGNKNGPTYGICQAGAAANDCHIKGFDCSGLTEYAYAQVGIDLPSTAAAQWQATRSRTVVPHGGDLAGARPGDLVFFTGYTDSFDSPGHVGIYIGDGKMVNAPQSGEDVKITDITTPGWQNDLVGITDPFGLAA